MRISLIIAFLLFVGKYYSGEKIRVGLYYVSTVKTVEISSDLGEYVLYGDSTILDTLKNDFDIQVYTYGDKVKAKVDGSTIGEFGKIVLKHLKDSSGFKIRSLTHNSKYRYYWEDVEVSMGKGKLKIVNIVDLENYLPGVVESESGSGEGLEYYKIQATISRTYALKHANRHLEEGFQLCDHTHCQVYRKRSKKNPLIPEAVKQTEGMVIVDSDINLITSAFYSNCGGQTNNSEDVWSKALPYLRSVKDPFCKGEPHYYWKKTISKDRWLKYVKSKMPSYFKSRGEYTDTFNLEFSQSKRRVYYANPGFSIPLKDIRSDFKLRSTYFSIKDEGDKILLKGRGFGHGVGVCQEGAMRMAELGFSHLEILKFYYSDIHLIHLDDLEFFRMD